MRDTTRLKVGTQVMYVPRRIRELCEDNFFKELKDQTTEFGFVEYWREDVVFCRFWYRKPSNAIRTLANSEGCGLDDLELYDSHAKVEVDMMIEKFRAEPERYGWREQKEVGK